MSRVGAGKELSETEEEKGQGLVMDGRRSLGQAGPVSWHVRPLEARMGYRIQHVP
jgi:hypothetical protein